jgi:hypothetical protein
MSLMRIARGPGTREWLAALLLVVAVLAPYHQLVTGRVIPIPDDIFASDLADGEFPARVEAGRILRGGELPVWTPGIMTGIPLILDPLSIALFAVLPPALALGCLIGLLLAAAALGAYLLSRFLGASRSGAFLAGFAFAWSGFFVCQLRHLSIIGTVACFPWALYCLERAAARAAGSTGPMTTRARLGWLTAFGAVFGFQALFAFPQSMYISALAYGALIVARACGLLWTAPRNAPFRQRTEASLALGGGALAAVLVGSLVGMAVLLPLHHLGTVSDRQGGVGWEFASKFNYYLPNWATFFVPYVNGDISDLSYKGNSIFWEDYGYVGLATVLAALAAVAIAVGRRLVGRTRHGGAGDDGCGFAVWFWAAATLVAYGIVVGKATPLYELTYRYLPGMSRFRFATRFMFVVELGLAVLAALGVTFIQRFVAGRLPESRRRAIARLVGAAIVVATMIDLVGTNARQNPMVDAAQWLSPPLTAAIIGQQGGAGRIYTPASRELHRDAFARARGWSGDLSPFYAHRDLLQPNANLLHHLPALDAYAGIAPTWMVNMVGDHNRGGLVQALCALRPNGLAASPAFYDWLEALSVRWLIVPVPASSDRLEFVGRSSVASVYRVKDVLPRARIAPRLRLVRTMDEAWQLTQAGRLDPRSEVLVHDPADLAHVARERGGQPDAPAEGEARIVVDRATEVVVEASSRTGGLLVLADAHYPGWEATVDGRPAPILQVNVIQRGVATAPGRHRVAFEYRPAAVRRGLQLTGLGTLLLLSAAVVLRKRSAGAP